MTLEALMFLMRRFALLMVCASVPVWAQDPPVSASELDASAAGAAERQASLGTDATLAGQNQMILVAVLVMFGVLVLAMLAGRRSDRLSAAKAEAENRKASAEAQKRLLDYAREREQQLRDDARAERVAQNARDEKIVAALERTAIHDANTATILAGIERELEGVKTDVAEIKARQASADEIAARLAEVTELTARRNAGPS